MTPSLSDTDYESLQAILKAHEWLERVERALPSLGYFGLDHKIGENDDGCTFCHAAAVLEGRRDPLTRDAY